MKVKKTVVKIMSLIIVMGALTCPVYAAEQSCKLLPGSSIIVVMPRWTNISDIIPAISASGRTVYPETYVKAQSSTVKITGTMYLEKYSYGKWTRVTSWSISGTGSASLSKSYSGTIGTEYRTRIVVTVGAESAEATSGSCSI